MKTLSAKLLYLAEALYLRAHGWTGGDDYWLPPKGSPQAEKARGDHYARGHAINSTKYWEAAKERR